MGCESVRTSRSAPRSITPDRPTSRCVGASAGACRTSRPAVGCSRASAGAASAIHTPPPAVATRCGFTPRASSACRATAACSECMRRRARLPERGTFWPVVTSPACTTLRLERLRGPDALFALLCHPKIRGWHAEDVVQRQFQTLGRVAAVVPVYRAEIPWGPAADAAAEWEGALLRLLAP